MHLVKHSLSLLALPTALGLMVGCLDILDPVSGDGSGGGSSSSTSSTGSTSTSTTGSTSTGSTSTSSGGGGSGGGGSGGPCEPGSGLQVGAAWPMLGRCASHRAQSPVVGAQTAHLRWSVAAADGAPSAVSVTIDAAGTIYVPGGAHLRAFAPDGSARWSVSMIAFQPPMIGADGTLYVTTADDNKLQALRALDGSPLWSLPAIQDQHVGGAIAGDGTVIAPSGTAVLAATPAGSQLWSFTLPTPSGLDSSPAVAPDGSVYVSTSAGLNALSPTGSPTWTATFPGGSDAPTPTIAADGTVYAGDGPSLHAVSPGGVPIWSVTPGTGPELMAWVAIGPDGTLYAVNPYTVSSIYALSPTDGSTLWSLTIGGNYASAPAVGADGTIYVAMNEALYALRPNGTQLWAYPSANGCGAPAIGADGTVYAVCGGQLDAFGP